MIVNITEASLSAVKDLLEKINAKVVSHLDSQSPDDNDTTKKDAFVALSDSLVKLITKDSNLIKMTLNLLSAITILQQNTIDNMFISQP